MKTAIYPGSFNPWHAGHEDVLLKALEIFDQVIIVSMINPDKKIPKRDVQLVGQPRKLKSGKIHSDIRHVVTQDKTLKRVVYKMKPAAIIRGLRNGNDLQYEQNQQYWNEDVGIEVPFVYFIADRKLGHVSSSAIRAVNGLGLSHDYCK